MFRIIFSPPPESIVSGKYLQQTISGMYSYVTIQHITTHHCAIGNNWIGPRRIPQLLEHDAPT